MLVSPYTAGCDEAGRGPLAGPVIAAVVLLNPQKPIPDLRDSKLLSAKRRAEVAQLIQADALDWGLGAATVAEIDALNVLQATLLAMQRALRALTQPPDRLLVDGIHLPRDLPCAAAAIIRGDQRIPCISAASILAKTHRDALMAELDKQYPYYGFGQHKGYATRQHLEALKRFGATPAHRQSFTPVRQCLGVNPKL